MSTVQSANMLVFEGYCGKCKKTRKIHIDNTVAGNKEMDSIICICGNSISVNVLKYLFREKSYLDDRLNYFVQ